MASRTAAAVAVLTLGLIGVPATASAPDLRPTRITVTTSAAEVVVLTPVELTGRVNGDERRVELEIRDEQGWRRIDRKHTDELGKYSFEAPTRWVGKKRLRVVAPETRTHEAAKARVEVRVLPDYVPTGDKDAWKRLADVRARYDPCRQVLYAVNPRMLPADGMAVLQEALFRVEKASGLRYRYAGATNAIPFRTTPGRRTDKVANLVVAWSTPETDAANLGGRVLGRGGFLRTTYVPSERTYQLVRTGILFDAGEIWTDRGFENGRALGSSHMHLLGLALGLGQVTATDQVMYQYASVERPVQFGRGDLTGLARQGLDAGCLTSDDTDGRLASGRTVAVRR